MAEIYLNLGIDALICAAQVQALRSSCMKYSREKSPAIDKCKHK